MQSFRVLTSARLASCASGVCALLTPKPPTHPRARARAPARPRPRPLLVVLILRGHLSPSFYRFQAAVLPATAPHSLFPSGWGRSGLEGSLLPPLVPEGLGQTAGARGTLARPGGGPGWLRPCGGEPPEARDWSRHQGQLELRLEPRTHPARPRGAATSAATGRGQPITGRGRASRPWAAPPSPLAPASRDSGPPGGGVSARRYFRSAGRVFSGQLGPLLGGSGCARAPLLRAWRPQEAPHSVPAFWALQAWVPLQTRCERAGRSHNPPLSAVPEWLPAPFTPSPA